MLKRRTLLSAAAALALLPAATTAQAQIKLRYAHVGVANAPQTLYADEVAKLVKERTNGRIEIQVFANSQLGGVGEMVDGIKSGAIAMGHHDFASLGKILASERLRLGRQTDATMDSLSFVALEDPGAVAHDSTTKPRMRTVRAHFGRDMGQLCLRVLDIGA